MSEKHRRLRRWLRISGAVLWVLVFVGAYFLIFRSPETSSEAKPTPDGAAKKEQSDKPVWDPDGIADFELTERSGRKVTKADLRGHPWAVCFIFTRCAGPCPKVSGQMKQLQDYFQGSEVRLVTITVDPEYDTPQVLRDYAEAYNADPQQWLFLTGGQREIYELIGQSFKMPVQEMTGKARKPGFQVLHSTNILHVNARGVVQGKYNALKDSDMVALRRALEKEAERLSDSAETTASTQTAAEDGDR